MGDKIELDAAGIEAIVQAVRPYTRQTLFVDEHRRIVMDAILSASKAVPEAPVASSVLGDENDLHSVAHALDIGGIGTPYRAYQGSLYCDYQPHRIADFQDYGLALAASVLFNNAKAIKAALTSPPKTYEDGLREAAVAGWNACRKSIYAVCEDVVMEADRIRIKGPVGSHSEEQHSRGYHAGSCHAAKSIARGFNAMEAGDDDNFTAAIEALIGAPK